MNPILTCIDARGNTSAVIDWSAWAARQLAAPLEFLHVLERHPERAQTTDFSGALGMDAQATLLQQLSDDDAQRSRELKEAGRRLLSRAREQAAAQGVPDADGRLRHGDFLQIVTELQDPAQLLVLGEHYRAQGPQRVHLDHHMERVLQAVDQAVLVVTAEVFCAPQSAVVAFDGTAGGRALVQQALKHPLLQNLPLHLVMAGADTDAARRRLEDARATAAQGDRPVAADFCPGAPEAALPTFLRRIGPALLVMGANRHSRLRRFLFGSTTSTLLRVADVPVLVLR